MSAPRSRQQPGKASVFPVSDEHDNRSSRIADQGMTLFQTTTANLNLHAGGSHLCPGPVTTGFGLVGEKSDAAHCPGPVEPDAHKTGKG